MQQFWEALAIFLPAGVANMTPVLANLVPGLRDWNVPMDFGRSFHGVRVFGDHKTWRGLLTGVAVGTAFAVGWYKLVGPYTFPHSLLVGVLLSAGALLGDAAKSFAKRRAGVRSGRSWFPFDQLDYVIGGLLLSGPALDINMLQVVVIVAGYFGLHVLVAYVGWLLKIKEAPL